MSTVRTVEDNAVERGEYKGKIKMEEENTESEKGGKILKKERRAIWRGERRG